MPSSAAMCHTQGPRTSRKGAPGPLELRVLENLCIILNSI